jgi:hypothetical protein
MKRETFDRPGIRIETWFDGIRHYVCWKPHVSVFCGNRRDLLRFMAWPTKTPTGDALRDWLTAIEEADAKRAQRHSTPEQEGLTPELLATGFGPEAHLDETDPNFQTKMVT